MEAATLGKIQYSQETLMGNAAEMQTGRNLPLAGVFQDVENARSGLLKDLWMDSSEPNFGNEHAGSDGCAFQSRLSADHDGELDPTAAAAVQRHLVTCDACKAELAEIRELSALAASIGTEGVSPFGMRRIHRAIDQEAEPSFRCFELRHRTKIPIRPIPSMTATDPVKPSRKKPQSM